MSGMGANAKTYLDGYWVQDTNSVGTITIPAGVYTNKWCVWILNDLQLNNGRLNILGYQPDGGGGIYLGTKCAGVAIYNQTLTTDQIAAISQWGLQRCKGL